MLFWTRLKIIGAVRSTRGLITKASHDMIINDIDQWLQVIGTCFHIGFKDPDLVMKFTERIKQIDSFPH